MVDLTWLTPELAIGGRFETDHVEVLARSHRIAAIIDVRAEACDDALALNRHRVALLHLPTEDHCAIAPEMIEEGVRFALHYIDAGARLLVHCEHGIGRSALLALCVLVACGHEPLAALEHAKTQRAQVSPSPPQYEAWARWLRDRGLEPPTFSAFAAVAYRHLGGADARLR